MQKKKFLVFIDLDGTLVDSFETHKNSIIKTVLTYKKLSEEEIKKLDERVGKWFGEAIIKIFENLKKEYGIDESLQILINKKSEIFEKNLKEVKLKRCAKELLSYLKSFSTLILASNSPKDDVEKILEYFDLKKYFDLIIACENSDKTQKILNTIKILSRFYEKIIFIDDSPKILENLKGKGILIGVLGKYSFLEFEKRDIKWFKDLCEIINFFKEFKNMESGGARAWSKGQD